MTKTEYIELIARRTAHMTALTTGTCKGCKVCGQQHNGDDMYFAQSACDICGTTLGGDRMTGHYLDKNRKMHHLDYVCEDCARYLTNGDIPTRGPDDVEII